MQESSLARWDSLHEPNHNCVRKGKNLFMKLNLFNTVNNEECRRGQWSVVWLKRGQPCLHHLHVLSTTFSWQPLSLFSLRIILLPPSLPPPPQGLQILLIGGVTVTSASQVLECNFGVKYTKFGIFANPAPPLYFSTDESVWQVPGSIGMGVHGWRAWVCQPWRHNSV